MIAYQEHPESAGYAWEYRGGCYGDSNQIAYYEKAVIGEDYSFTYVPIEVREDESLYASLSNVKSEVSSGFSPLFYGLFIIFSLLGVLCLALFVFFFARFKMGETSSSSNKH